MNKVYIITIIITLCMLTTGFSIISNNIHTNNKNLQTISPISKPYITNSINYNFSFLNNGNYNASDIIVGNNSIWYYNITSSTVCGVNLNNFTTYNFFVSGGVVNNQIQLYIPLNYIYFISKSTLTLQYINLTNFQITSTGNFGATSGSTNYQKIFLTNYGIQNYFIISNDACIQFSNIKTIFTKNYIYNLGTSPINYQVISSNNWYANVVENNNNYYFPLISNNHNLGQLTYPNMVKINNNIYNENTTYFSSANNTIYTGIQDINTGNYYTSNYIIPTFTNNIYGLILKSNNTFYSKDFHGVFKNPLFINSVDYNSQFYLNTNYHIISNTKTYVVFIQSYTSNGALIDNYYLHNGIIQTYSYLNNSIPLKILPLNYGTNIWNKSYIIIGLTNYTGKSISISGSITYYYNISIYYSTISNNFVNPFSFYSYLFPLSVLLFFILGGLIIYGKKESGKK